MTAVAKLEKSAQTAVALGQSPMFSMLERIMLDTSLPLERVKEAWAFHREVEAEQARRAYFAAFAQMQPSLPVIGRKGQSHNAKYARWEDIVEQVMPVLKEHGFGISFRVAEAASNRVNVTCLLMHTGGHAEETSFPYPFDTSGGKNAIQAIGSATSYGKRYTASVILNLATKNEDDDGKAAAGGGADALEPLTDTQAEDIRKLVTDTRSNLEAFLEVAKAESVSDIVQKDYPRLRALLLKKKGQQK